MNNMPRNPMKTGIMSIFVAGLRSEAPPSEVKIYKLNPDGTQGDLIRIEQPQYKKLEGK